MDESTIRGLSLWQPWASLVAAGLKGNETRPWLTTWRSDLLICSTSSHMHAPSGMFPFIAEHSTPDELRRLIAIGYPAGCALAVVRLANIITTFEYSQRRDAKLTELMYGNYEKGRYCWVFEDLRVLRKPYPIKGRQRLWHIKPQDLEEIRLLLPDQAA